MIDGKNDVITLCGLFATPGSGGIARFSCGGGGCVRVELDCEDTGAGESGPDGRRTRWRV